MSHPTRRTSRFYRAAAGGALLVATLATLVVGTQGSASAASVKAPDNPGHILLDGPLLTGVDRPGTSDGTAARSLVTGDLMVAPIDTGAAYVPQRITVTAYLRYTDPATGLSSVSRLSGDRHHDALNPDIPVHFGPGAGIEAEEWVVDVTDRPLGTYDVTYRIAWTVLTSSREDGELLGATYLVTDVASDFACDTTWSPCSVSNAGVRF